MPGRIRRMTARELETLLRRHGFELISQRGSHRKWRSGASGATVVVPAHRGKQLPPGTLRSILQASEIPETQWRD